MEAYIRKALHFAGELAIFSIMVIAVTALCLMQLGRDEQTHAVKKEETAIHTATTSHNAPRTAETSSNGIIPEATEKPTETIAELAPIVLNEEITEQENPLRFNCPLDAELQDRIVLICEEHNINPAIIIAMAERESTYRADAIGDNGNSFGLCQIMRKWHEDRMERLGVTDLLDPFQNVTVAVDYLAEQLARYDGDIGKALTAYNQGSYKGAVSKYAKGIIAAADELAVIE